MRLKLLNEFADENVVFGPLPNFKDSFENYFIRKAFQSQYESSASDNSQAKYIVNNFFFMT